MAAALSLSLIARAGCHSCRTPASAALRRLLAANVLQASFSASTPSNTASHRPASYLRPVPGGVSLFVHCKPGCSTSAVSSADSSGLHIRIGAEAIEGAASQELIRFIAATLGVSRGSVSISKGANSSRKLMVVRTTQTVEQVEAAFNR